VQRASRGYRLTGLQTESERPLADFVPEDESVLTRRACLTDLTVRELTLFFSSGSTMRDIAVALGPLVTRRVILAFGRPERLGRFRGGR
jgi:hypothetical protein